MAFRSESSPDYLRGARRVVLAVITVTLVGLFLIWRIDNARVEQLRVSIVDRFVPSLGWTVKPMAATARMLADLRAYGRVYQQNEELRRELQRMQGWREAALQLEQKNARLLALNHVRLNPRTTYVTAEVMADAGSPFRRSATVNVGAVDGVSDGSAVVDGLGLVGRIAGVAEKIVADHLPQRRLEPGAGGGASLRLRAIVTGDNGPAPTLDFVEQSDELHPGDRVVSSGDGGLYPPDLLIGQVFVAGGRQRVRLAADFRELDFVRVLRREAPSPIEGPGELIGPMPLAQAAPPVAAAQAAAE